MVNHKDIDMTRDTSMIALLQIIHTSVPPKKPKGVLLKIIDSIRSKF